MRRPSGPRGSTTHRRAKTIHFGIVARPSAMREALTVSLCRVQGLHAVDCGVGNAESIERARDLGLDLILIELDSRVAVSFASTLRSTARRVRAVVLLRDEDEDMVSRLARAGVVGFVASDAGLAGCVRALRAIRRRGFHWPPEFSAAILKATEKASSSGGVRPVLSVPGLHGRQLEVAECLARGLSNKDIGAQLRIAEGTVKSHVHAVLAALGVQHRWNVADALRTLRTPLDVVRGTERSDDR
jgi:DNA-binding NarL/FixJ family response regulator